jgi:phospholipid/cholesterol/gamma-HCH transport system substrate-binding protein/paraquat-inducible protein B
MSQKAHFFKLGLFIVCALALAVAGIIVLGAGKLFEKKTLVETYFTESVQGLEVGAPVRVRGVRVGRVESIHLAREEYQMEFSPDNPFPYRGTVVVRMSIRPQATGQFLEEDMETRMKKAADAGLRVRLASQGITGVLYIESDFVEPEKYPPLKVAWTPKYPYIPSAPSTITELGADLKEIAEKLKQVEIDKVTRDLDIMLTSVTQVVKEVQGEHLGQEAKQVMGELRDTLQQARRTLDNPNLAKALKDSAAATEDIRRAAGDLSQTAKNVRGAMEQLPDLMARLNKSLRRVDLLLASKSETVDELLDNLRSVSEELRHLTNSVERYPSQVLFGEPPPKTQAVRR